MFKLSLATISPIMQMAPPFEQTLIRNTQGLFVCDILEFCSVVLEKKIFKGLVKRNHIFAFFNFQSSAKMALGGVSL